MFVRKTRKKLEKNPKLKEEINSGRFVFGSPGFFFKSVYITLVFVPLTFAALSKVRLAMVVPSAAGADFIEYSCR
jgi:hypothetical protein